MSYYKEGLMFSSALSSKTLPVFVLPVMWETKLLTHIKLHNKFMALYILIFIFLQGREEAKEIQS
jgi:hypothetical protein